MVNEDQSKIDFSEYENVGDELLSDTGRAINGVVLPDDMHPLARRIIYATDGLSNWQGRIACLFVVPITFGMFYGMSFMLGAAYALMRGLHIRVDSSTGTSRHAHKAGST